MNLLVTGGSGFIGSNFINYWLGKHPQDQVTNVDNLTYAADPGFLPSSGSKDSYVFVRASICDFDEMRQVTKNSDVIINFAAESHVDRSIEDPSDFVETNIVGVHTLLQIAKESRIRFHQVSTDEVYGSLSLKGNEKFTNSSPYNPRNPYAASKAAADFMVRAYHNTYGLPATISNCSNNFGPMQYPEKLIPKAILSAFLGKPISLYGDGRQVRDWIFVRDHCSALEIILESGNYGSTSLVGAENETSNLETIKILLEVMGLPDTPVRFVKDRPGHDVRYAIDPSDFRKQYGWAPQVPFREGLKNTVEHYVSLKDKYYKRINRQT